MSKYSCPRTQPVCLADIEEEVKNNLFGRQLAYFEGGADEEVTLKDNIDAFKRLRLRPRMLRGISEVDMSTTLLGQTISMPICVAPSAFHRFAHPDGERGTAKASASAKTCMILSMATTIKMEDVALAAPNGLRWSQLVFMNKDDTKAFVSRIERAGYKALVFTVDTTVSGKRRSFPFDGSEDDLVSAYCQSEDGNLWPSDSKMLDKDITWDMVGWIKSITKLPVILKGILTAEDAKLAVQHGADAIIVSNHGGRQLDGVLAGIDALPEVVSAVNGQIEVYMDGGVRLGTDVLKALALGARAVFIGRPVIWGLAYQGEEGVLKVLEIVLREEFRTAMILSGCSRLSDISPSLVTRLCQCNL